jgi:hypothetical protein
MFRTVKYQIMHDIEIELESSTERLSFLKKPRFTFRN